MWCRRPVRWSPPSMHRMLSSAEGLLQAQACAFSSSPTPASLDFLLTRLQWRSPSHLWTTSEPSPSCLRSLGTTSSTHSICKDKILTGLSQMSRCGLLLLFWFLVLRFQKRTLCMDADNWIVDSYISLFLLLKCHCLLVANLITKLRYSKSDFVQMTLNAFFLL